MPEKNKTLSKLYQFLAMAIETAGADKGNVQFFDAKTKTLKIVAHTGFNDEFLRTFETVTVGHACCGEVLEKRERVIVEDTSKAPSFTGIGSTMKRFGYGAVHSTPLFDASGQFFGVVSVHFVRPRRFSAKDFTAFDEYVKQAAPLIASKIQLVV